MLKQLNDWWPFLGIVGVLCFFWGYVLGINTKRDAEVGILPPKRIAAPDLILPPGPIRPEVRP